VHNPGRNELLLTKTAEEILTQAATQMDLEDVTLSENPVAKAQILCDSTI
jgi:hypothetical protein